MDVIRSAVTLGKPAREMYAETFIAHQNIADA
jgi:hypothetical protein